MQKEVFERLKEKDQELKLTLKPKGFILYGKIGTIFEDCFEFITLQKSSYIDFGSVMDISPNVTGTKIKGGYYK